MRKIIEFLSRALFGVCDADFSRSFENSTFWWCGFVVGMVVMAIIMCAR